MSSNPDIRVAIQKHLQDLKTTEHNASANAARGLTHRLDSVFAGPMANAAIPVRPAKARYNDECMDSGQTAALSGTQVLQRIF